LVVGDTGFRVNPSLLPQQATPLSSLFWGRVQHPAAAVVAAAVGGRTMEFSATELPAVRYLAFTRYEQYQYQYCMLNGKTGGSG